jgi:hypothetical protein
MAVARNLLPKMINSCRSPGLNPIKQKDMPSGVLFRNLNQKYQNNILWSFLFFLCCNKVLFGHDQGRCYS